MLVKLWKWIIKVTRGQGEDSQLNLRRRKSIGQNWQRPPKRLGVGGNGRRG